VVRVTTTAIKVSLKGMVLYTLMVRHTGTTQGTGVGGSTAHMGRVIDMNTDKHYLWYLAGAEEYNTGTAYFGDGFCFYGEYFGHEQSKTWDGYDYQYVY